MVKGLASGPRPSPLDQAREGRGRLLVGPRGNEDRGHTGMSLIQCTLECMKMLEVCSAAELQWFL